MKKGKDQKRKLFPPIEFVQEGELSQFELEEVLDILAEQILAQQLEANRKHDVSTRKGV